MRTGAHTESRLFQVPVAHKSDLSPEVLRSDPSPGPAKLTGPECCGLHAHLPGATLASLQCVLCGMVDSSDLSPSSYPCVTSGGFLLLPWSEPLTQPSSGIFWAGFLKLPLRRSPLHMLFPLPGVPFPVALVSPVFPSPEWVSIPIF